MIIIGKTLVPICVMRIILTSFTGAVHNTSHVHLHDGFGCVSYVKLVKKIENFSYLVDSKYDRQVDLLKAKIKNFST